MIDGKSKSKINEWLWGWFLVAPAVIGLIILNIIPAIQTFYLSFFKSGDFGRGNIFIGLENYKKLINDSQVWYAVRNTLLYTLFVVPVSVFLAAVIAVLLNKNIKGRGIYRSIYYMPVIATPAAVTMVWRWLYNYHYGLINYVLKQLGLNPVNWIDDPKVALISIAIISIWSTTGYNMVLILAGLQDIPTVYYEASNIDGANAITQFFKITIPLVSPTLFFVITTSVIQCMQVFDVVYMMIDVTRPSYDSTVSLVYLFYNNSFKYLNKGYGSAIVMVLLLIISVITVIQVKLQKRWVNYMG
ncbi:putative carbohydrate uptake ABC transporter permease protein [Thermoclostridium stercorarium subsp. stercorarium DSM 8532]|uniref:Sugar ABC transporter permease n=3 Tax=Thermoclostridium stercorarium TaxID=1510 RepID=A0A1B1YPK0_THEST|nr:sugar ABC transporter permease [Thermoclostridium stercorarium]AGC68631.1 putative carbohydrate uptake ABC transporter permease protein [Thermoclostridium stercorarium subsp. stercorarium DSM 8532]AGI39643.1 ABC transporter periplasmic subunit-1 [Thermoclostridium stercorarium subsp. stercorarium DSM 8532]ANX00034.1 sugar ABC transporter permease [Thermoclostridium stercorarium subsp. thermolacticum DSM 2910]ANX02674.1 sugar ABC transporter permease [Thermoclostridium stercorarium subsp. lep